MFHEVPRGSMFEILIFSRTGRRMSLTINGAEAHRLAQAIARTTGEGTTHIVTEALRQ